jgi:hypothetical protein
MAGKKPKDFQKCRSPAWSDRQAWPICQENFLISNAAFGKAA